MPPAALHCDQCGREYRQYLSMARGRHHFCSMDCYHKHHSAETVTLRCTRCGAEFERRKGQRQGKQPFCSRDCMRQHYHELRLGGRAPFQPEYRVLPNGRSLHIDYLKEARAMLLGLPYTGRAVRLTGDDAL